MVAQLFKSGKVHLIKFLQTFTYYRNFDLRTPLTLFVISSHRPNEHGQSKLENKTG